MQSCSGATSLVALGLLLSPAHAQETTLTVMTYNIWGGGANEKKPINETLAVIRAVNADIIGVQETRVEPDPCTAGACAATGDSVAKELADALGFYVHDQTATNGALWANAILSRYPIGPSSPNDLGVKVYVDGRAVLVFNVHLDDSPYQPYQLLNIEYGAFPFLKTAVEAIDAARQTREPALKLLFADMDAAGEADTAFVFGDFNEPSHRDRSEAAAKAGRHPMAVAYPTVKAIEDKGFVDTFRAAHPDEVAKPGFTWTPTSDPTAADDHHDRIDVVLARGRSLEVLSAGIAGEKSPEADLVITPWPSDHRASYAKVKF